MSSYLLEHFLKNYQGKGIFVLNDNEIKRDWRFGIDIRNEDSQYWRLTNFARHPMFKDGFFLGFKNISYQETNQSIFKNKFI